MDVHAPIAAWSVEDWKSASDIVSNVITAGALIAGAVWAYWRFVRERTRWPRAAVQLSFEERVLDAETLLFNVTIEIKNEGRGRMDLSELRVDVYRVRPLGDQMRGSIDRGAQFDSGAVEANWPLLEQHKKDCGGGKAELEPGETEEFTFDFFLDSDIETVSVYAYLENVTKSRHGRWRWSRPRRLGWSVTRLHDMKSGHEDGFLASLLG
jgi:hypothetical protein